MAPPPTQLTHLIHPPAAHSPPITPLCPWQGLDMAGVDALLELLMQEQRAHPGYLGGLVRPSQQLRQHTPPAGLSTEGAQAVRQASVRLFADLGLRDFAQFSGWVLPPRSQGGDQQQQQQQQQQRGGGEAAEAAEEQQQRPRTFAELLDIDAQVRAQQQQAASSAVSSADRAAALDTTAAPAGDVPPSPLLAAELAEAAAAAGEKSAVRYGWYNGLQLDDSIRTTGEQAAEALAPFQRCGGGWRGCGLRRRLVAWTGGGVGCRWLR